MMKRAVKKKSSLYEYLEPYLEAGNEAAISAARRKYWKDYKAKWRKNNRQENKEITITYTRKEYRIIETAAKKHKRSCAKYIKESSLAYSKQVFLIPDVFTLNSIKEILTLNYNALQHLEDENKIPSVAATYIYELFSSIENTILKQLQHPKNLEQEITNSVKRNLGYKTFLLQLLQSL